MKSRTWKITVEVPSEPDAGIQGFTEEILVTVQSGHPIEEDEFPAYLEEMFGEWYDTIYCTVEEVTT